MAKARTINAALTRAFEQSLAVVYVISDSQTVLYANQACADWVGLDLESLVGTRTVYSSEKLADAKENLVKGMALPPEYFSGIQDTDAARLPANEALANSGNSFRISANQPDGKLRWRAATINSLKSEDQKLIGVLVVGTSIDEPHGAEAALPISADLHQLLAEVRSRDRSRYQLKNLIGQSTAMQRVLRQSQAVAKADCDFLVVGPPGSGREHLAKSIFNERSQKNQDYETDLIPIHCAIVDPIQIQQTMRELVDDRKRRSLSSSEPGDQAIDFPETLLLIDVDQLDERSQIELLGFLELPGFPFRAIATAATDITKANGSHPVDYDDEKRTTFIPELAARLSTMVIELLPLKNRREDLPLLSQAILEQDNVAKSRQLSGFSKQALEMICEFDWPRNFDQLVSTIDAAALSATGNQIQVDDFPTLFRQAIDAQQMGRSEDIAIKLDEYLAGIESELVKRALAHSKGNKTQAAKSLGISRPKLLRRLHFFGLMGQGSDEELLDASVFEEADE